MRESRYHKSLEFPDTSNDEANSNFSVVCFSHLRWNFVFQRPQQLLSLCAMEHPIFFVEEPIFSKDFQTSSLHISRPQPNVSVLVPHLPESTDQEAANFIQNKLLDDFLR